MKRLLALATVALASTAGFAADKGTEFKFGGEIRQEFIMDNNVNFSSSNAGNVSNWLQKNQFHINAVSSDKLQAYFNLVHAAVWGSAGYNGNTNAYSTSGSGVPTTAAAAQNNSFEIGEAWMWWKVSDNFTIRTGRQGLTFGEGFVASRNDDLPLPYFIDGIMARWSFDFMDADFGGAKMADFGYGNPNLAALGGAGSDSDINIYGINLGFKSLPEIFKKLDVFFIAVNGDASTGMASALGAPQDLAIPGMTGAGAWNLMTYGLFTKMEQWNFDLDVNAALQSGKQKGVLGATDTTFGGNAFDVRLGYSFPEFMKGHVFVGYHSDSGFDNSQSGTNNGYQPLFYDVMKYSAAGIWGMGNLTDMVAGVSLNPGEDTMVGVDLDIATRTTTNGTAAQGVISNAYGNYFQPVNAAGTDKSLGTVVAVWAKENYGHGFNIMANVEFISLGNYYKPSTATNVGSSGLGLNIKGTYSF